MGTQPAVLFPDATKLVIDGIRNAMAPTPVVNEVPATRPTSFVRVLRTGGVRATPVSDAAHITIEAWASPALPAETADAVAQRARQAVTALAGTVVDGSAIYRVDELAGPGFLPDLDTDDRRITFTVVVHTRGA